ncbi:MAG: EAL domain-containing protein [Myxococcota bacterium]
MSLIAKEGDSLVRNQSMRSVLWVANKDGDLREALRLADHAPLHIIACHDAAAAKAALLQQPIDLAVVDLGLSSDNPLFSAGLIRHMTSHFPDTVVVAKADEVGKPLANLVQQAGAVSLHANPLTKRKVSGILHKHLVQGQSLPKQRRGGRGDYVQRLDDFLAQEQIQAFLQPIVDIDESPTHITACHGLEALARPPGHLPFWNPGFLFTYASLQEQFLAVDLKCAAAALESGRYIPEETKLFINLQPRSLIAARLVPEITALVREFDMDPRRIVVELTEQQAFINPSVIIDTLAKLRRQGFQVALDDFGEGFSNLQFVQNIKPDYLKLSGSFCRDLHVDRHKQIIVRTVVQMARELRIHTIIEQVEKQEELEQARKLGIAYAQGYLFARPMPPQQLATIFPNRPMVPVIH